MVGAERYGVPLGFDVPAGWRPVQPAEGTQFTAIRPGHPDFAPNMTLSIQRRSDNAEVTDIADEAIGRLAVSVSEVQLLDRREVGHPIAPGLAQALRLRTDRTLAQSEVFLVIPLDDAPADRLVVELVCTCTPDQLDAVTEDFERFVASFHVRAGG